MDTGPAEVWRGEEVNELGAMVRAEVDEIRSHDGTAVAEVDAEESYVSVIAHAPKNGNQNAVLLRSVDTADVALIVFDEAADDDFLSEWEEGGWEIVAFARPL